MAFKAGTSEKQLLAAGGLQCWVNDYKQKATVSPAGLQHWVNDYKRKETEPLMASNTGETIEN